jgi:hypothetical protein
MVLPPLASLLALQRFDALDGCSRRPPSAAALAERAVIGVVALDLAVPDAEAHGERADEAQLDAERNAQRGAEVVEGDVELTTDGHSERSVDVLRRGSGEGSVESLPGSGIMCT